jgi:flagellar hook-associated protein FlgK
MSAALNIGNLALNANLAALQVIGHNIANANTAGYSRQNVEMTSAGYQTLGGNFYGKGVLIGTVTRSHDAYLTREARSPRRSRPPTASAWRACSSWRTCSPPASRVWVRR